MIYIYGLKCPIAKTIRYVGKSNNPEARFIAHRCTARTKRFNHHTARWLRKLERQGLKPELEILERLDEGSEWAARERYYIENGESFGWLLTNSTPGGEGGGFVRPEDKAAWVENVKTSLQSEDVRLRISAGVKAAYAKDGMRQQASKRTAARWQDKAYRDSITNKVSAAKQTPEARENMRQHGTARMADPEERKSLSEKMKAYYSSAVGKEKHLNAMRSSEKVEANRQAQAENWKDPEYRERQLAAKKSPAAIEKQKSKAAAQWADPQIRAKMLAAMAASALRRKSEKCHAKAVSIDSELS